MKSPAHEEELFARAQAMEGLTFLQLGRTILSSLPDNPASRKGWIGKMLENALGVEAPQEQAPDFKQLHIELKTIPIGLHKNAVESTFITHIALDTIHQESWHTSMCYSKLRKILWIPVEGDPNIPFPDRRIGRAILWSPSFEDLRVLQRDWEELVCMITTGQLEAIHAGLGEYLQIRPKAANGRSLCKGYDNLGYLSQTLPRGFYLRASFTSRIL